MLRHLSVQNYALVQALDIEFSTGLSVITGESGAGKSILLGALGLVLGERADSKSVRHGASKTEVSAEFNIEHNTQAKLFLENAELSDPDEPGRCLLRRVISAEGRSRAFINGTTVTLKDLRNLCASLIYIHAQDENMALTQRDVQLDLLDAYGVDAALLAKVHACYTDWQDTKTRCTALGQRLETSKDRQALISYQVEELDELALSRGEYEDIDVAHRRLAKADDLQADAARLLVLLDNAGDSSGEPGSLLDQVRTLSTGLADIEQPSENLDTNLRSAKDLARNALDFLEEAQAELGNYLQSLTPDPQHLSQLETRLGTINDLSRKHKVRPENLAELHTKLKTELANVSIDESEYQALRQQETTLESTFMRAAKKLGKARRKAAAVFSKAVSTHMQHLGIKGGQLEISFSEQLAATGLDAVDYQVITNPKYPAASLSRVASGGERTRISLSIQVVAAEKTLLPTLVLDEADVGVGGKTSDILGRLLRKLAANTQVLCVTHAPQVAALGHQHLVVEKTETQDSSIATLDQAARIEELARMLGGKDITAKTRQYAEELISFRDGSS